MTKKHFEAIAAILQLSWEEGEEDLYANRAILFIANSLADTFAAENPRFNRSRFLKACGVKS